MPFGFWANSSFWQSLVLQSWADPQLHFNADVRKHYYMSTQVKQHCAGLFRNWKTCWTEDVGLLSWSEKGFIGILKGNKQKSTLNVAKTEGSLQILAGCWNLKNLWFVPPGGSWIFLVLGAIAMFALPDPNVLIFTLSKWPKRSLNANSWCFTIQKNIRPSRENPEVHISYFEQAALLCPSNRVRRFDRRHVRKKAPGLRESVWKA